MFATLLILGLVRLERSVRKERERIARERNLLLGVTHELKTPLASVQLGLDSLRRLNLEEKDKSQVLSNMQEGIHDLGNLVDDMLVATRAQRKESMQLVAFSWLEMVHEALSRMGEAQRHRIEVVAGDKASMEVTGDKALWSLATSNLVENALKYSEGRSSSCVWKAGSVAIEVRDEGQGIPAGSEWKRWNPSCDSAKRVKERDWDFIWFRKRPSFMGLHWRWKTRAVRFAVRLVWPQGR